MYSYSHNNLNIFFKSSIGISYLSSGTRHEVLHSPKCIFTFYVHHENALVPSVVGSCGPPLLHLVIVLANLPKSLEVPYPLILYAGHTMLHYHNRMIMNGMIVNYESTRNPMGEFAHLLQLQPSLIFVVLKSRSVAEIKV